MAHPHVVVEYQSGLQHQVIAGHHRLIVDEPLEAGGENTGPDPYDLLLGALGTCASMTMVLYARRKGWPLQGIRIELTHDRIHAKDCETCTTQKGLIDRIQRTIVLTGPLSNEQIARLTEVGRHCPVHQTLITETQILDTVETRFEPEAPAHPTLQAP